MKKLLLLSCVVAMLSLSSFAGTVTTLYANNAVGGTPYIYQINATTGAVMNTYSNLQGYNGRGVIDVGNTLYYTTASSGNVYTYDLTTQMPTGVAFTVGAASGLASITYDGKDFWIGDYSGSNQAFLYSPTGTLLNTITLANCTGYCDGLTYFKQGGVGYLLSNRFDGGFGGPNAYDIYTTNGALVSTLFTSTSSASTGVAWDGTSFWTSNIFAGSITQWSMTGTQGVTNNLTGWSQSPLVEGMSFNFQQTVVVPEPGTLVMFGSGVLGLAGLLRRKFNV